ncbi:unnamed protein product [Brassica oleracea var. botrytis]
MSLATVPCNSVCTFVFFFHIQAYQLIKLSMIFTYMILNNATPTGDPLTR